MKHNRVIILLIVSIIVLVVSTQLFVHKKIKNQQEYYTIINYAGKQRMLSQVIAKTVLKIQKAQDENQNHEDLNALLRNFTEEFSTNHESLKNGNPALNIVNHNSVTTQLMFEEIEESFKSIKENSSRLIVEKNKIDTELIIHSILSKEESFLSKMNAITYQYNIDFASKNKQLEKLHLTTYLFIIMFLILEFIFLVRPTFKELLVKNKNLRRANKLLVLKNKEVDTAKSTAKSKNRELETKSLSLSKQKEVLKNQLDEIHETADINEIFIKNLTYSMRVPLNAMVGMLKLLDRTSPTDEQNQYINSLTKIAKNSISNINNVISFQELEANKIKLQKDNFNIKDTINSVYQTLLPTALEKSIKFNVQISDNIPPFLIGDTRRIKHIIYNLTYNGIKSSLNGMVSIDVFLNHINQDNMAHLDFAISDSSYGISDEASPYVFELIQPKGKTTYYNSLELAIAKKLLELQESTITVESIIGQGTTFYFSLILPIGKK